MFYNTHILTLYLESIVELLAFLLRLSQLFCRHHLLSVVFDSHAVVVVFCVAVVMPQAIDGAAPPARLREGRTQTGGRGCAWSGRASRPGPSP